jgi:hypothetical protein
MADFSLGNAKDSLLKTVTTKIDKLKSAVSPEKEAVVEKKSTTLTEGYAKHPVVAKSAITPADFYRRGKISGQDTNTAQTQFDSNVQANNTNSSFEVSPRRIEEFGKEDGPASIRLVGKVTKGSKSEDKDLIPPYTKFLLESVQESHQERSQIVETFGDFYVFFFGERPPIYSFSGTLVNSQYINWVQDFHFYYENFLRGTKSVENNARIVLTYGGRQVEGFILNSQTSTNAQTDNGAQFSFQLLVIDRKILKLSADFGLIEDNGRFATDIGFLDILVKTGLATSEVSKAWNDAKAVSDKTQNPADSKVPKSADAASLAKQYGKDLVATASGKLKLGI